MTACAHCGLALAEGDEFCGNCGQPARPSDTAVIQAAPAARPAPTPARSAAPPTTAGRESAAPMPVVAASPASLDSELQSGAADPEIADVGPYLPLAASQLRIADVVGEPTFDPLRNKRLLGQMARRFVLLLFVAFGIEVVFLFVGLILSFIGGFALATLAGIVSVLVAIALFLCFWLLPVPAMLAYGSKLISDRAPLARRVMECIAQALDQHATPRDSFQVRPLSLPGEGRRDYLELRRGIFAGYISSFPHGHDLYMGWTFWIYMSPWRLLLMRIGRTIQNFRGRGNDLYQTLRYESVRATVGAIQICTREGLEVALGEADGGAPYSLPEGLEIPIG